MLASQVIMANMSKYQLIILLALIVMLLPFLGFTSKWDTWINVVLGLFIIILAKQLSTRNRDLNDSNNVESNTKEN